MWYHIVWMSRVTADLHVYRFFNLPSVGITVGRADVNDTNEVCHAPAQVQHTISAHHVQINGYLQRLVKAHGGRAMEHDINSLYQHISVFGLESQLRQAHVTFHRENLVQRAWKLRSYPVENLPQRRRPFICIYKLIIHYIV